MDVLSAIIISKIPSLGVTYHLKCYMEGLNYLPLDTNSPGLIALPSVEKSDGKTYMRTNNSR